MKQVKRIVACLCGLLVAVQTLVPFAYAMPGPAPHQAMHMHGMAADCPHCKDHASKRCGGDCGMGECAHSAGCGAVLVLPPHFGIALLPADSPRHSTPRAGGFVPPDPDPRLRPPALHIS